VLLAVMLIATYVFVRVTDAVYRWADARLAV
jgi:hypothetical protein